VRARKAAQSRAAAVAATRRRARWWRRRISAGRNGCEWHARTRRDLL
jgi:hypothetical protein